MDSLVVEYPPAGQAVRPVTRVRSTLITSSIKALRERGHFDRWSAALDAPTRDTLLTTVAATWLPIDLAMRHYDACDSLHLLHDEIVAIGQSVGTSAHESMLHVFKQLATTVGVTPWTFAQHYERGFTRAFDGGGFRITKVGPKDSTIELVGAPMARSPYFRAAFCGVQMAGLSLITTKCYVRVVNVALAREAFTVRTAWV